MLFLALYCVFNSMEQLSFDTPEETDVVRRFLMWARINAEEREKEERHGRRQKKGKGSSAEGETPNSIQTK